MAQDDIYKQLFNVLCTNNIDLVFQEVYNILKHPISLVDVDYNVIGLFPNKKMNDPLWDSMFEHKIVTYDMVYALNQGNYQKKLDENDDIFFIDYGIGEVIPRIAVTCKNNNRIQGYICILYPSKDYHSADYELIRILSNALALCLRNTKEHSFTSIKSTETFIKNLFEEKITTTESLKLWIQHNRIDLPSPFLILSSKVESGSNNVVYLKQLRNIINNRNDNHYATLLDEDLYILCTNIKNDNTKDYINSITDLIHLFHRLGFSIGVSTIFYDLLELRTYKYQASRVLELNTSSNSETYIYEDYILTDIFSYAKNGLKVYNYENSILKELIKYDALNKTEYYQTLRIYIQNFCDSNDTINMLNIHRNTLLYRLQKIEEITSINLKDKKLCTKLLCDIYMSE
ncbi:PucR family transcriptional regulator [Anaeromicropila herbilytica]|uniref:PucR C-terminal helix-turn-helix domain-containing protein n=1 Tax=Anaeromicropila herbilytica TaxID=2785025 RepID=A0A7R7EJE1_9FIRM|nr:helix-turn-helix domain-containing protein [Anaeromicropila herbilytica]BCN29795.1 hypothetical protein bsdtb5_10900 [Anaeromicropila herbilytica]